MALRKESDITHVAILEIKVQKVCSANSVRADVLEKYVMDQILEIIKSKKVLKQLVEKVNEKVK